MSETKTYSNPYKFNGKELDTETGLAYYGARYYSPELGVWYGCDPLMEKYPQNGAYVFCNANPVKYIDPDGRKVIIDGEGYKKVFLQLEKATKLKLSIDENGVVSAKGKAKSGIDKVLYEAINDEKICVNIHSTEKNYNPETDKWFIGGAFNGSKTDENGIVQTSQTINPNMTAMIDDFYELGEGVSAIHELIESYMGGKYHPNSTVPTYNSDNSHSYFDSHNRAVAVDDRFKEIHLEADANKNCIKLYKYDLIVPENINPSIIINDLKR